VAAHQRPCLTPCLKFDIVGSMPMGTREEQREYQRLWIARRRQDWIDEQGGKCHSCGSTDRLEVDHIDPSEKSLNPTAVWSLAKTNPKRIAELAKCQVLCYDCHLSKTLASIPEVPHGTHTRYVKYKCRCSDCRAAHAVTNSKYR
jgi:5-methylcytosine-specific restriction endonuclease McrA